MKIILGLTSLIFIAFCTESIGQELKLSKNRTGEYLEEYTVLKENKKIRHGQYIRFRINSFGEKSINIIGFYNQGHKTDNWLYFSHRSYLEKEGKYLNDLKEGLWIEYYEPKQQGINTMKALNSAFEVNKGITIKENGEIEINRSDIIKAAEGTYHLGKKISSWLYYSSEGSIVHNYNHSSESLLVNNNMDNCPYLGGYYRFYNEFTKFKLDATGQDSKISFQIYLDSPIEPIKTINCVGDCTIAEKLKNILNELRTEFIKNESVQTKINFTFKKNEGGLFQKFEISFEEN